MSKHHSETDGVYQKYRRQTGPGKGDRDRTGNREAYREGWDRIFGKDKKEKDATAIPDSKP